MASTEIKPVKLNSDKLEALPKYRKISKSVSLIEAKSKSFPNLSTTPDKTKLKSNKTSSGSNLAIKGVKLDAKKQDDLNLKKTLSKLSQFGTTIEEIKIEADPRQQIRKTQADPRQQIRKTHSEREIKKVRNSENKNTNSSQKMKSARKILDRRKTEESFSRRKSNLESEDGLASKLKTRRLSMDVELVSFDKCKSNNFAKLVKMKRPEEVNRNKRKHENKIIKAECVLNKKSEGKRAKISADHDVIRIKPDKIDKIELEGADLKPSIPEEADVKPSISEETNVRKPSIPEETNAKPSKPEKADAKPSIPEETDVEKPSVPEEAGAKPSIPEKADVKPSIPEETDVEKPSVPEEAGAKLSIPEKADVKPSIAEETDVEKPSVPEEAGAKPSIPEKADVKPSIAEETDVEKPSVPEEAGAKPSIPEKADVKPSIAEETDVEKPSIPEEADAKSSIPEKADVKPSIAEQTDIEKLSIPEEADAKPGIPEKADTKPSIPEETDVEKPSILADVELSVPDEVIAEVSEILNEILLKIEDLTHPSEIVAEFSPNKDEILEEVQAEATSEENVTKIKTEELQPKISHEIQEEIKPEPILIKTLKELATACLNAEPPDVILLEKASDQEDENLPKLAESEDEAVPTPTTTGIEIKEDKSVDLEKVEQITNLPEHLESPLPLPQSPIVEEKLEESKEDVQELSPPHNIIKSYTRKPIIEKRHNDVKQSLQKEVPFHYVPKKKRVTFNAKEIILNATEFEKSNNTELNIASPKILNFDQSPPDLGGAIFHDEDKLKRKSLEEPPSIIPPIKKQKIEALPTIEIKLKRKSLEEPPSIIPPIKKQKIEALPTIEIEKLKLSVRNKLERNQTEQKTKEQTLSSPTKRRDRKNIDEVINILRSNLEEKIEITIVQVIDEEKPNETAKIAENDQKTRLFQPWQDPELDQAKLQTEIVEVSQEDTQQEPISAIPENVQEIEPKTTEAIAVGQDTTKIEPKTTEAIAVGQDTTSQEVVPPEKDVKTIEAEADVTIEPELTKPEVISPENDDEIPTIPTPEDKTTVEDRNDEIPTIPTPEDKTTVEDRNVTENIFSTSTPLRLIQREYSFSSEEDAEPKNDEAELIVEDNLIETVPDDDPIDDKTMPNLSPIADQPNEEDSIKLTTDSQLTPPPILQKELPTPIGTNFATSALLDGADDAMTSVLEDIPTAQEKTFNFAAEDSLFDDNSKTSDMKIPYSMTILKLPICY
ncbi:hypothetical protein QE152_g15494 [Popillia japonica]|uniref:Zonadhesin n=1 Tax=Popillia japonica TaxID=7064 RepID=A0AAW1L9I7_POPJA